MIQEIAQFIEDRTSFVIGETLFVGHRLQSSPARCVVVLETDGGAPDVDLFDRLDKMIQIITRAEEYLDARIDATEIYEAIHGLEGMELPIINSGDVFLAHEIRAISGPAYIGQDEERRFEFSTNYVFMIRRDSCS